MMTGLRSGSEAIHAATKTRVNPAGFDFLIKVIANFSCGSAVPADRDAENGGWNE
jgi:hypothetical protein